MSDDKRVKYRTEYTVDVPMAAWVLVWPADGPRSAGTFVRVTWIHLRERVCTVEAPPPAWVVRELRAEGAACPSRPPRTLEGAARRAVRGEWGRKAR